MYNDAICDNNNIKIGGRTEVYRTEFLYATEANWYQFKLKCYINIAFIKIPITIKNL